MFMRGRVYAKVWDTLNEKIILAFQEVDREEGGREVNTQFFDKSMHRILQREL